MALVAASAVEDVAGAGGLANVGPASAPARLNSSWPQPRKLTNPLAPDPGSTVQQRVFLVRPVVVDPQPHVGVQWRQRLEARVRLALTHTEGPSQTRQEDGGAADGAEARLCVKAGCEGGQGQAGSRAAGWSGGCSTVRTTGCCPATAECFRLHCRPPAHGSPHT
ncbi:hypothetical protein HaLaN_26290 [Haematococcus lacustris]|uniref:Uncharacterized protein n=1 Tax=Haematococcus lacustris TaxID=44745 RepID=A0A6A0A5W3_HAELA|nr:hypothetical protein HaLaN_26290 [Haematococcus lacustris]